MADVSSDSQLSMLLQEDVLLRAVGFLDTKIQHDNLQKPKILRNMTVAYGLPA
jgi:hypothetical protein